MLKVLKYVKDMNVFEKIELPACFTKSSCISRRRTTLASPVFVKKVLNIQTISAVLLHFFFVRTNYTGFSPKIKKIVIIDCVFYISPDISYSEFYKKENTKSIFFYGSDVGLKDRKEVHHTTRAFRRF